MKFNIITLGCKVNSYESEMIKENLIKENFLYTDNYLDADILIINTCSVTNMADNKSKKQVRKCIRLNKIIVVCGCSSENKQDEYSNMKIDILIGNKDKSKIGEYLKSYLENKNNIVKFYDKASDFEKMQVLEFKSHTRAFVKIEDGCNNYCSYCIIPYVRGSIRSKNFSDAVREIKTLVENNHKEIVLTGILTGSYNSDGKTLADLIEEISKIPNLERIRISSIEVTELDDKMLDVIKNNQKVVNHFHIPLQAGSDEILKRMNRKYNLDYFEEKINTLRKIKKDVSITTDVIVGHPYETEDLFNETINTCLNLGFSKIHVFPFSKRDGTPSSKMPNQVCDNELKRRSKALNEVSLKLEEKFYKEQIGKCSEVLIEEIINNESIGFTSNYIKVKIKEELNKNTIYKIMLTNYESGYLIGKVIS